MLSKAMFPLEQAIFTTRKKCEMEKVLVIWEANWADEMDIYGFVIVSAEEARAFKKKARKIVSPFEIYVGTNEEIEYSDGKQFLKALTFRRITLEESKIIEKFFGESAGHSNFWDFIEENEYDEEDYEGDLEIPKE